MRPPPSPHPSTRFPRCIAWALLACGTALLPADVLHPDVPSYLDHPGAQAFIQSMVTNHAFEAKDLSALIGGIQRNAEAIELVKPPLVSGRKNWRGYRTRFVEPRRIRAGVEFWRKHAATLARAEKESGVPAEIVVGIIGVETLYGRHTGRFPVLDVLATLAFDYPETPSKPRRSAMFLRELEDYLLWCRDLRQDAGACLGSYTGAIGIPQFLPSSIRAYAVDYDGDDRIDLRGSPEDAIGSVAHYLRAHGWEPGRPPVWHMGGSPRSAAAAASMADGDPELKRRMGELLDAGIRPRGLGTTPRLKAFRRTEQETKVLLVDLPTPGRPTEYRIGLNNFYVITRYNRSFFYAAAVVDLGKAVKDALRRK